MNQHVLDHAELWIGDGRVLDGHIVIGDGHIKKLGRGRYVGDLAVTDLGGAPLSPGMIDSMVLGGFNKSILRDDPLQIAHDYLRIGVTGCLFCGGMLPWDELYTEGQKIRQSMVGHQLDTARVLGIYPEGPFEHPDLTGASLRDYALPPSKENVQRVLEDFGDIVPLINISPGTEGDVEAVRMLCAANKVVSMAHSDVDAKRVLACVDAGITVIGHIWDNNSGRIGDSGVQQPTIEHVALTDHRVRFIHMLCDGVHVHPILVNLVLRCRGTQAICLVTDAIIRAGCPDGPYWNDDGRRFTKSGNIGRTDKGHLCGSALLLPDHFRNFVKFTGTPPHEAIRVVTHNPAASLNMDDQIGLIKTGLTADLVAWDDRLRVCRVWRAGQEVNHVSDFAEIEMD